MNAGRAARFLTAGSAAVASAVVMALVLAVVDLYLSGHGLTPLGDRRLVDVETLGVHLSAADATLLTVVLVTTVLAARLYRR